MASQVSTKIRLVRCPKCRQVLAELPDVKLYKCGGCGTVLQAKTRNMEANCTESSSQSTDSVANVQQDNNASEQEEGRGSNHDLSNLQNGDNLQDEESTGCQDEHEFSRSELCENTSATNALSTSPEVNINEMENSTVEVKEPCRHDDDEAKESTPEASECCTSHHLDNFEGENVVDSLENLPENDDRENDLPSLENEETAYYADVNGGLSGVDSSTAQVISDKNVNESQPSVTLDGDIEKKLSASIEDSSFASGRATKEITLSLDEEHLDRLPMRKFRQNFGSASSVDTLASSPPANTRSNFPATRNYYGNDGSESSYDDDDDDQSRVRISHPSRRKGTSMRKTDAYKMHDEMLSSEAEMNYRAPRFSSHLQGNQHRPNSKLPFTDRTRSPSIYEHNLVPCHPNFRSEPDEMELLRTVHDLKDQLNRIQLLKARETYADLSQYPRYHPHNHERPSRLAFSGEVAHYRHQTNCSCLHCCPQDRHFSAQLPSDYCGVHNGHNHFNVSSFSSPEHYTSSELSLWAQETHTDNLRRRELEMQRLLREKHRKAKRHLRPVAGGVPLVPCCYCSELLQLPADFLLFKKRYHQLKCGACGEILRFSLLKNKHIVPYLPDAAWQRNSESISRSACQNVGPVSCDDHDYYAHSSDLVERKNNRYMRSGSFHDPREDRKMKSIMKESDMDLVDSFESVGPSSTLRKLETEKMKNSPLHRLMGYGSARQVLNK